MNTNITHVALYTKDLEKSKAYYVKYFHGICNELYENKKGFKSYFITFKSGARLELMYHNDVKVPNFIMEHTGWSHIAFSVGCKETVLKLTERIMLDGYQLYSPARATGDGYFESCVADPDGNRVEITV